MKEKQFRPKSDVFDVSHLNRILFSRDLIEPSGRGLGRADQTVRLSGPKSKWLYRLDLRRISDADTEIGKSLLFVSNNFEIDAAVVAKGDKARWHIELFFKWTKQNMRINKGRIEA